jgi:hypothetical protein
MSNGILMDHSKNTIGMDLSVIFFTLLHANETGHIFLTKCLECNYNGMGLHSPCNFISHVKNVCKKLKGFVINFMSCLNTMWNLGVTIVALRNCAQWRLEKTLYMLGRCKLRWLTFVTKQCFFPRYLLFKCIWRLIYP